MKKFATVCLLSLFATTFLFSKIYTLPADADYTATYGNWGFDYYVDKYWVKTEESYIYNYTYDGLHTNTATRSGKCEAELIFDGHDKIRINAWEYGSYRVDSYESSGESYYFNVTAKDSKGYSIVISTGTATLTNYFCIQGSSTEPILDALAQGKDITITLIRSKNNVYRYVFNFKAKGFAYAYTRNLKDALEVEIKAEEEAKAEEETKTKAAKDLFDAKAEARKAALEIILADVEEINNTSASSVKEELLETFLSDEIVISGNKVSVKVGETTTLISCPDNDISISEITSLIDSIEPRYKAYFENVIYKKLPSGDIGIYYKAISKESRLEVLTVLKNYNVR